MTVKQNLEIEQSKLREKLNAYAAEIESGKSADWTEEDKTTRRSDYEEQSGRLTEIEPALRAAIPSRSQSN